MSRVVRRRPGCRVGTTTTRSSIWSPSGWSAGRAGSPRSACCRPPGRRAMRGPRATSDVWSRRARRCGAATIIVDGARRCGPRASTWSSTGVCWAGYTCSARSWRGAGSGSCASPTTSAPTRRWRCSRCFDHLGGVPGVVLADRMGCLKGGVVANTVVPTAQYVRFASHHGFRPDFCEAPDPESKRIVENLVGYAKTDRMIPGVDGSGDPFTDLGAANTAAATWCVQVNAVMHSEICAVPAERLIIERELLAALPSLRASIGRSVTRKVDRLACVRFGSARYSVPVRFIGEQVRLHVEADRTLSIM